MKILIKKPPLVTLEKMRTVVPLEDCSGRKYPKWECEDIARYMVQGAEMQRDDIWYGIIDGTQTKGRK